MANACLGCQMDHGGRLGGLQMFEELTWLTDVHHMVGYTPLAQACHALHAQTLKPRLWVAILRRSPGVIDPVNAVNRVPSLSERQGQCGSDEACASSDRDA